MPAHPLRRQRRRTQHAIVAAAFLVVLVACASFVAGAPGVELSSDGHHVGSHLVIAGDDLPPAVLGDAVTLCLLAIAVAVVSFTVQPSGHRAVASSRERAPPSESR
jgi:hypothetical protein